uniref:Uncharacterized protein n=1 Tax=viral metagenome TaxID=1070528 RepID=A0A6C0EF80_9ZZZZ
MNNIEFRIQTINQDHIRIRNRLIQDADRRHSEIDYELFHKLHELINYTNQLKNEIIYENRFNPQRNNHQQIQNPNANMLVRQLSGQAIQIQLPRANFRVARQLPGQEIQNQSAFRQNQTQRANFKIARQLPGQGMQNQSAFRQIQTPISNYRVVKQLPGPYPAHR